MSKTNLGSQAPITIFMIDTFLQILANVTFMFILFGEDRSAKVRKSTVGQKVNCPNRLI